MAVKRTPRPRDPIQLGKLMVDIATGAVPDGVDDGQDSEKAASGRMGGLKGGISRAEALSSSKKQAIAKAAALIRWERNKGK